METYNFLCQLNAFLKRHTKFFKMLVIMLEAPSFSNQIEIPGIMIEIQGFGSKMEFDGSKY